ncbi:serine hydrolase [Kutzneria buriramensis]|uniref:Beta-lactamase class A n=1 Tax=Kutzneria buriramensis TaxID=1045776 RepID=A0A3E0H1R1_9PSEU|nr:serine hydrolase [Kutzneria buriramensis]REH36204.1 hypothetical protein BCF44_11673 [Kutzneria buriramensis]
MGVASLALVGCGHVRATGGTPTAVSPVAAATSSADATTSSNPPDPGVAAAAAEADGQFSLLVFDRVAGQVVASHEPTIHYPAESVVKLFIAITALEAGGDEESVVDMLAHSDDEIANKLWTTYGETAIVTGIAAKAGMVNTTPPNDPGRWGDTQTTAEDLVALYRYILDTVPEHVRSVILRALSGASQTAADGLDQYFGIPDAATGWPWAVKQGWACCKPNRVLHTTGLLGKNYRYIVVALSSHDDSTTWEQVIGELTEAVRSVVSTLRQ